MTIINTNISALTAQREIDRSNSALKGSMNQLATGSRINTAADDAAGLAITDRMTREIDGMQVAARNTADGISAVQTADGTLKEITDVLRRMKTLALQAASDTMSNANRAVIQKEMTQLQAEIKKMAESTEFNGIKLLDGGKNGISLHTGVATEDSVKFTLPDTSLKTLGIDNTSAIYKGEFITGRMNQDVSTEDETVFNINGAAWKGKKAPTASSNAAKAAEVINQNTTQHGVVASAFNEVVGKTPASDVVWKNITVNGVTIKEAKSAEEFAKNVNAQLQGQDVVAKVNANGGITFTNDTGNAIEIGAVGKTTGSAAANADLGQYGLQSNKYEGFVSLKNADGSTDTTPKITINRDTANGGTGTSAHARAFGINELHSDGVSLIGYKNVDSSSPSDASRTFDLGSINFPAATGGYNTYGTGVRLEFGGSIGNMDFRVTNTDTDAQRLKTQLNQPAELTISSPWGSGSLMGELRTIKFSSNTADNLSSPSGYADQTAFLNALNSHPPFASKWKATISSGQMKITANPSANPKPTLQDFAELKSNWEVKHLSGGSLTTLSSSKFYSGGINDWYKVDVDSTNPKKLIIKPKTQDALNNYPTLKLGGSDDFLPHTFAISGTQPTHTDQQASTGGALLSEDNVRINGVLITTPNSDSMSKVAAINKVSKQTGVKASIQAMVEFTKTGQSITINGTAITGIQENNMADAVKKINEAGGDNFKAELVNGKLRITSYGAPLKLEVGDKAKWSDADGNALTKENLDIIHGRIILSKVDGSSMDDVSITAKDQKSMDKLGLTLKDKPADYHTVSGLKVTSREAVQSTLKKLDKALETVNKNRADIGAFQNRLEVSLSNINQSRVNLTNARGRVLDVDYSIETLTMTKKNILKSGATAVLVQARQMPKEAVKMIHQNSSIY